MSTLLASSLYLDPCFRACDRSSPVESGSRPSLVAREKGVAQGVIRGSHRFFPWPLSLGPPKIFEPDRRVGDAKTP